MSAITLISMGICLLICIIFFILFELKKPRPELLLPIAVIITSASLGRIIFGFIPQVQPVTALVIICGYIYGGCPGFICGSTAALISNMYFGHGPWTLFQMTAWGIIGFIASFIPRFKRETVNLAMLTVYGFISAFLFSIITDTLTVSYLGGAISPKGALAIWGAGIIFNIPHSVGNIIFMTILYPILHKKLDRINSRETR